MQSKLDENTSIENMKQAYLLVDNVINDLDNKSFQMLSVIGVMFTIQVTLLLPLVKEFGLIIFLSALVCYCFSALFFLKACILKTYALYPTNDSEVYFYEYEIPFDEYVSGAMGDYNAAIVNNVKVMNNKSNDSKLGFYLFIIGLFLTLLTVFCVVL